MTAAATLAKRRTAYLDGIADAALADEDAKAEHDNKVAEAAKAARKHREELSRRRDKLVAERLEALSVAEAACHEMIAAMHKVRSCGGELATVYVALGERPPPGLSGGSARDSLSGKLSATLRQLADHGGRFGGMTLARSWRQPDQPWTEEGVARLGAQNKENENG